MGQVEVSLNPASIENGRIYESRVSGGFLFAILLPSYNGPMSEGPNKLLDFRNANGSRHFASIPDRFGPHEWQAMQQRLSSLVGVTVTSFVDIISQAITDFTYRGHEFAVDTQFGELWFFTPDPECPDELLAEVIGLFRKI